MEEIDIKMSEENKQRLIKEYEKTRADKKST